MNYTVVFLVAVCIIFSIVSVVVVMNKRWFAKVKTLFGFPLQYQANCDITTQDKELLDIIEGKTTCNLKGKCFGGGGDIVRFTGSNEGVVSFQVPSISFQQSTGSGPQEPTFRYQQLTNNFKYSIKNNQITFIVDGSERKGTISNDNGFLKINIDGKILTPITSWSEGSGVTKSCS